MSSAKAGGASRKKARARARQKPLSLEGRGVGERVKMYREKRRKTSPLSLFPSPTRGEG
jgi:hypothetical protein